MYFVWGHVVFNFRSNFMNDTAKNLMKLKIKCKFSMGGFCDPSPPSTHLQKLVKRFPFPDATSY